MNAAQLKALETKLWSTADNLRANSNLTSNEYCMPILGIIFLRYAYSRYRLVAAELMKDRPKRFGKTLPLEPKDFTSKSALYLPREAQYAFLLALPEDIASAGLAEADGKPVTTFGEAVNHAMTLIEAQSAALAGVLPKTYHTFDAKLLRELFTTFNDAAIDDIGGDVIGRIYEYFLNNFAQNIATDDGAFFTPKSLVKMIVGVIEPARGVLLDPACGSGGMFVQTGDFVNQSGMAANDVMTFYGQEKTEYNANLCRMNIAVHNLNAQIRSGEEANTYYNIPFPLVGACDYVMANPPFNVDKVSWEGVQAAGRLPFGAPSINKDGEVSNANYLWISYFYAYLNDHGRAGFVMPSSATDSRSRDWGIRRALIDTGDVDVLISVGNNFFYTKTLPCTLWFFRKDKPAAQRDTVLFLDARTYYTAVDRTHNAWNPWQLANLLAIVHLYRGEREKAEALIERYQDAAMEERADIGAYLDDSRPVFGAMRGEVEEAVKSLTNEPLELPARCMAFLDTYDELKTAITETQEAILAHLKPLRGAKRKAALAALTYRDDWTYNDYKKQLAATVEHALTAIDAAEETLRQFQWFDERFGDLAYHDVPGLCKRATRAEIHTKDDSLTPGAYVGVPEPEDDGVDFAERMTEIHDELAGLQQESDALMETILGNWKDMRK